MIRRRPAALTIASLLAGCSMEPRYERPAAPVPPTWPAGTAYPAVQPGSTAPVQWQQIFQDARLQSLITQALANNRDLRATLSDVVAARARYRIQRAELLPAVDASASTQTAGNDSTSSTRYSVDVGLNAFEIDLFGRLRSLSNVALNDYLATEAGARATRLTLVGDIATAWLTYAADASLLTIAEQTAASAARSVELTSARLRGGIAPRTDLRQAEQILAQAQADVALSRTALAQDRNALDLLVGAPVDPALLPTSIEQTANAVAELPAGVDSAVLLRRPDVVASEYDLRAANAQISAARAALFPRISLTAFAGLASGALDNLFKDGAFNWSVSPTASYSIFSAGAGRANVRQARAQQQAALARYEGTIQSAFREVADALARRGTIDAQTRADERREAAARDSFVLTEARYRGGVDSYLAFLDAQRSLYTAQRNLIGTRLTRSANLVTLYRVLGGEEASESVSPAAPVAPPAP